MGVEAARIVRVEKAARAVQAILRHRASRKQQGAVGRNAYRPLPPRTAATLENPVQPNLRLLRIAQPAAQRAVEVEQQARRGGIAEVLRAEDVKHLRHELDATLADVERPGQAHVPREIAVVLAQRVAL